VLSANVPEESSRRSVQQLENSIGRAQFWCEEPACRGVQQNGGVSDQRCQKPACRRAWSACACACVSHQSPWLL